MCTTTTYIYTSCGHNYTTTDPCPLLPRKHYPKPGKVAEPYRAKGHGYVAAEVKGEWCESCEWEKRWRKRAIEHIDGDEGDGKKKKADGEEDVVVTE
jgi:hypothetical protein